ncbi:MAG: efflux RND transporter periplasmic adaptor subunit [Deltaproteobacteria bacterium]|nr:efflux RND transporter periplasmic adaptor subunit [Deltaproteobacteria bacterium]
MKRIIVIAVVLAGGLAAALYFRIEQLDAAQFAPAGGSGIVEAVEVDLTARIPGRIARIAVDEGDAVEVGKVLVELDCAEPLAALSQAKAGLSAAEAAVEAARAGVEAASKNSRAASSSIQAASSQVQSVEVGLLNAIKEAERIKSMNAAGAISDARLDQIQTQVANLRHQISALEANTQAVKARASAARGSELVARAKVLAAEAQVEVARAAVRRAEAVEAECRLASPRSGVVLSRNYEPGEAVLPGARLLTIADLGEVRATFFLPNAELSAAAPGREVTVRADAYPDKTFHGVIRHVSAKAEFTPRNVQTREDRDRLVFAVEISVPNPQGELRPGMPIEVSIDGTERTDEAPEDR